jgi:cytoskeletal protein RodZ
MQGSLSRRDRRALLGAICQGVVLAPLPVMNVGAELAAARNQRGLSLEDIAGRTKVSVERLDAIERVDIEHLPPRVYLLGFVRAYAREVGLEPDEVAQRYVAQVDEAYVDEELATDVEESAAASAPPLAAAPASAEPVAVPPWRPAQFDEPTGVAAGARPHARPPRTRWHQPDDEGEAIAILPPPDDRAPIIPVRLLLIGVVIAVALGVVLSASLYKSRVARSASQANSSSAESSAAHPDSAVAPAAADASGERAAPDPTASRDDTPVERPVAADTRESPSSDGISGQWWLTTRVDSSAYKLYEGLTLGYALQLEQRGNRITGSGHKVSENGRTLRPDSRTPIAVEGKLNGQRLDLKFTERGSRRVSGGTMVLEVGDDGSLRGTFSSDAAQSRGTSQATRMSTAGNGSRKRDN